MYAALPTKPLGRRESDSNGPALTDYSKANVFASLISPYERLLLDELSSLSPSSLVMLVVMLAFLLGACRELWVLVGKMWEQRRKEEVRVCETVRTITGRFHRSDSRHRWSEGEGSDHNGILFHAVLLYIAKCHEATQNGEELWCETAWRNKPSVLFLFDPLKSDTHLVIGPTSFEYVGVYYSRVEQRAFYERRRLRRYVILRLPTCGLWMPVADGIQVTYQRRRVDGDEVQRVEHVVHLRAMGADSSERLDEFVSLSLQYYVTSLPDAAEVKRFYFQMQNNGNKLCFKRTPLSTTKSFEALFFPRKKEVLTMLDRFMRREGRFAVEGLLHKLGFLLSGPPGTGKTSFAVALAAYTSRHVISLSLPMISTNRQLHDIFLNCRLECVGEEQPFTFTHRDVIFLFDDVSSDDALVRRRSPPVGGKTGTKDSDFLAGMRRTQLGDAVCLSSLLNVLDGVVDTPSRIVVMTTRDSPSGIDPALLRPGRISYKLHMGNMRLPELLELLSLHYGTVEGVCRTEASSNAIKLWSKTQETEVGNIRQLRHEEIKLVRSCVAALAPDDFSISGALAESMCFASPTLDGFLDELRRRHISK